MRTMYDTLVAGVSPADAPAALHALVLDRVSARARPAERSPGGAGSSSGILVSQKDARFSTNKPSQGTSRALAVRLLASVVDPEHIVIISPPPGAPGQPPPPVGSPSLERTARRLEPSRDRGTLPAVLLGILDILPRDPEALVLVVDASAVTAPPPPDLTRVLGEVVADPCALGWFSWAPGRHPGRFAEGLAVLAEARQLLRVIRELNPVWSEALVEAALDERAQERAFRMLPPAELEPHALAAPRPTPCPAGSRLYRPLRRVAGSA